MTVENEKSNGQVNVAVSINQDKTQSHSVEVKQNLEQPKVQLSAPPATPSKKAATTNLNNPNSEMIQQQAKPETKGNRKS